MSAEFVQGTCEDMCPAHEIKLAVCTEHSRRVLAIHSISSEKRITITIIWLSAVCTEHSRRVLAIHSISSEKRITITIIWLRRTKEHLLHFFEQKQGEKGVPCNVVKAFSRSAAGIKTPRKTDLRTPRALLKTIEYLLKDIIMDKRKPMPLIFDFVFDRLRCVRQEIVMQSFDNRTTLNLLEPIIMFLAYSRYRLCDEKIENFDPAICNQHLQECLKKALCCYDELDLLDDTSRNINMTKKRSFIEAMYQAFNLGSYEALERSLHLSKSVRNATFNTVQQMSMEFYRGNYLKAITIIKDLPHILAAIASLKLQFMRRQLYLTFSHAYNSKNLTVPIKWLQQLFLYSNNESVLNDCKYYCIEVQPDGVTVKFSKSAFQTDLAPLSNFREHFVEEKLKKIYLPEILWLKKF